MNYKALSVEDRLDIENLFALYAYHVDDGAADEWIAMFTDDGVFDVPGLDRFEGPDALRKIMDMVVAGSGGNWRHQTTNVVAEPGEQSGTANVRLRTLVTDWSKDPAGLQFNDYRALLRKVDGNWRIAEIVAIPSQVIV